jgi:DNA-binding NtrC family response regulator
VHVPALRERQEDIPILADHFLQRFARRHGLQIPGFSAQALAALQAHSWPGNVRELQNTIERAVILTDNGTPVPLAALGLFASPGVLAPSANEPSPNARPASPIGPYAGRTVKPLHEIERQHILWALEQTGGNRTKAATLLEISIRTLRNKLHEYRLAEALCN